MQNPMYKQLTTCLILLCLLFVTAIHAEDPELMPGKWEFVLNDAMSKDLEKIADMIEEERAIRDSEILEDEYSGNDHLAEHTQNLLDTLTDAQKPQDWYISEEKAKQGVIAIFGESDSITKEPNLDDTACVHSIEWKNQYEGLVSAECADGSVIEGIVKVPDNKQIQYEATVTPAGDEPYPIGWNAKWIDSTQE